MIDIRTWGAGDILSHRAVLVRLLLDAIHGGASVGFLAPLDPEAADSYWMRVEAAVRGGSTVLLAAEAGGSLAGCVQLGLASMPNGRHRAELMKLLVHSSFRRQGVATRLMEAAEREASRIGRTLLVLDTERDSPAERLYGKLGWSRCGEIPEYAMSPDGSLHTTVYYFKRLGGPQGTS